MVTLFGPDPSAERETPEATGRCSKCGQAVWWALTTHGNRTPMDPLPVENGNLLCVDSTGRLLSEEAVDLAVAGKATVTVTVARRGHRDAHGPHRRWRTHFAACPYAAEFRRKR